MELYASHTSPYARKVRMAVLELGLEDKVRFEVMDPWAPDSTVPRLNPLGKIPVLVTDDGETFFDSPLVCEYLDAVHGKGRLIPAQGQERWRVLRLQALADGITDAAVNQVMERRRPPENQSTTWLTRQATVVRRGLDALAEIGPNLPREHDVAALAILAALGYLDFRLPEEDWRHGRGLLAEWFNRMSDRDSYRRTDPNVQTGVGGGATVATAPRG